MEFWTALVFTFLVSCSQASGREKQASYSTIEGDMVLPKEVAQAIAQGKDPTTVKLTRGAMNSRYRRWPAGVVPYEMSPSVYLVLWKYLGLKAAMKEISEKTCIRFKKRTDEQDYVYIMADGVSCYSRVGRSGGKQPLSLGFGCGTKGVAIHELAHALGLWHEQSRPDRDDYVEIVWDNIVEDQKHNFRKYSHGSIDSLGSPYDYNSIMHYGSRDFSKFPYFRTTIKPKKKGVSIGQRRYLSEQDAVQLNKLYECPQ